MNNDKIICAKVDETSGLIKSIIKWFYIVFFTFDTEVEFLRYQTGRIVYLRIRNLKRNYWWYANLKQFTQ